MIKSEENQKELDRIRRDFKSLGYFALTRNDFFPGVLAVKVVNGSVVFVAADYEASCARDDCVDKIVRYFHSGFDGVLIATPNTEVKHQMLIDIDNRVSEKLRRNVAVVVMEQEEKGRRRDEAKS